MYLSPIHYAMRSINQMHLVEDAMVMYRLTHASDIKIFRVDVGRMTRDRAEAYVQDLKRKYEQKKYYNSNTGDIDEQKQVRVYGENYWFPKLADGRGTEVDLMSGAGFSLGEMYDLDWFANQVYAAFGVPNSRRSIDGSEDFNFGETSSANITRDELKFHKMVINYRSKFTHLFVDAIKKDLIATKAIAEKDWSKIEENLDFVWEQDNEFYLMKKMQVLKEKFEFADSLDNMVESGYITKEWVVENVLGFTRQECDEIKNPPYAKKDDNNDGIDDFDDKNKDYYDQDDEDKELRDSRIQITRNPQLLHSLIEKYDLNEGDKIKVDENNYIVKDNELVINEN